MTPKMIRWLIFSVLITLIPMVIRIADYLIFNREVPGLFRFFANGELLIISFAILVISFVELFAIKGKMPKKGKLIGGLSIFLLCINCVLYGFVFASRYSNSDSLSLSLVAGISFLFFILTVVAGIVCIRVSEAGR